MIRHAQVYALTAAAALSFSAGVSLGQSGYSITGGLSNFDCTNRCDTPCDEFEIEIEDIHPSEIYHTYHNGNYGTPMIVDYGTFTRVSYHHPAHVTPIGTIEHFGISLRNFSIANSVIRVRWLRNGHPVTVNGSVPVQGGGSAPNT
jgi:hypothetical protein